MKRKPLIVFALLCIVLFVFACSNNGDNGAASPDMPNETVKAPQEDTMKPTEEEAAVPAEVVVEPATEEEPVQIPPPSTDPANIALASNGAVVRVDSTFTDYTEKPLNDGYRFVDFLEWDVVAWASNLEGESHWVEITFAESKKPKKVDIHWAEQQTSQEVHLQVKKGDEWVTLKTMTDAEGKKEISTIELDEAVETMAVRLFQEKNKGPKTYSSPNIMWIAEIEIYE